MVMPAVQVEGSLTQEALVDCQIRGVSFRDDSFAQRTDRPLARIKVDVFVGTSQIWKTNVVVNNEDSKMDCSSCVTVAAPDGKPKRAFRSGAFSPRPSH